MSDQSNNQETVQELRHNGVGFYPLVFLVVAAVLAAYLGVILYSSPGKVKKAGKYKTEKTYEKKPHK